MPIYEYRGTACHHVSLFFTRSISGTLEPVCSYCGGQEIRSSKSSFAHYKSLKTLHEESGTPPPNPTPDYYKDTGNVGRYVEEFFMRSSIEMPESLNAVREGELSKGLEL